MLCFSCINNKDQKVSFFNKELRAVPVLSSVFDSLLYEVGKLSAKQQIEVIYNISLREENCYGEIKKQEELLHDILKIASKKEKKKILQRLIVLYQKLDQLGVANATSKGINCCVKLETQYTLSRKEKLDIKNTKTIFYNRQGSYKGSISILYDLLNEHREVEDIVGVIQDLYEIATYFVRLGDLEKSLTLFREAYSQSIEKKLFAQQASCLSSIIGVSFRMGRYNEIVDICQSVKSDSITERIPFLHSVLAKCYLQLHEMDSARYYLNQMNLTQPKDSRMVFFSRMAETFISEIQEDSATFYLNKAVNNINAMNGIKINKGLPLYFINVYPSYASLLHKNGKIKQASEAFQLVEPLMKAPVSEPERMEKQIDALSRYSDFCLSTKQYEKATELLVFRDSIQKVYYENKISLDAKNWTGRFEIQELTFDNEKKQEEINNTKRISSIIATVSFILFGFTVVTVCMYRYIRKQNKKLRENQAQMALLLNPKPVVVKKREPLTPQEQLLELASKTVKSQKLFLNSKLTLDELAEILGTNRSTLSSCINQCAKCNFNKWINNYRIDYIKKRITATSNSRDLCTEAGFNSINTFTNSFKERLGCTPGEYIDRCKYETLQEDTQ